MKRIDILNFITDFRKAPNEIKTHQELLSHLGVAHAAAIEGMIMDLMKTGVLMQTERNGEKAYQVTKK